LDILRAVAVLLVLGRHFNAPAFWSKVGWVGVDLFFVLSGFLISGLLFVEYQRTGGINWGRFFIRRGFKIYPAFYALIFVTFLWQVAKHQDIRWRPYLPEVLFFQSYQPDRLWGHTWSLAVEEHFYILLPLLLLLMVWLQRKRAPSDPFGMIPVVCLILAIFSLVQRFYLAFNLPAVGGWWQWILYPTHLRIDSLFFGVFLGYLHHFHAPAMRQFMAGRRSRIVLLLVSALLVSTCGVFAVDSPIMLSFGLTALYIGFGGILMLTLYSDPRENRSPPKWFGKYRVGDLVAFIGMYSYSIYLWHGMVAQHSQGFLRLFWPKAGETALFGGLRFHEPRGWNPSLPNHRISHPEFARSAFSVDSSGQKSEA
jgi:peptidoglycan/LPS O-acetylase OafA/YrhL